jgi:hypothetical protein
MLEEAPRLGFQLSFRDSFRRLEGRGRIRLEEVLPRHGDLDSERSSSLSKKSILFTKVDSPGPEAIRGKLHGKGVVDELLATHSTQVTACLSEVGEVFSATPSEDTREKLSRKGLESGMG